MISFTIEKLRVLPFRDLSDRSSVSSRSAAFEWTHRLRSAESNNRPARLKLPTRRFPRLKHLMDIFALFTFHFRLRAPTFEGLSKLALMVWEDDCERQRLSFLSDRRWRKSGRRQTVSKDENLFDSTRVYTKSKLRFIEISFPPSNSNFYEDDDDVDDAFPTLDIEGRHSPLCFISNSITCSTSKLLNVLLKLFEWLFFFSSTSAAVHFTCDIIHTTDGEWGRKNFT